MSGKVEVAAVCMCQAMSNVPKIMDNPRFGASILRKTIEHYEHLYHLPYFRVLFPINTLLNRLIGEKM